MTSKNKQSICLKYSKQNKKITKIGLRIATYVAAHIVAARARYRWRTARTEQQQRQCCCCTCHVIIDSIVECIVAINATTTATTFGDVATTSAIAAIHSFTDLQSKPTTTTIAIISRTYICTFTNTVIDRCIATAASQTDRYATRC